MWKERSDRRGSKVPAVGPRAAWQEIRRSKGFTLVELLLVMVIIGLLASILMPSLIQTLQKARQKRTMTDMRGAGLAWMSWLTDQTSAAAAGASKYFDTTDFVDIPYTDIYGYLRPSSTFFYAQEVPQRDGWGGTLKYSHLLYEGNVVSIGICSSGSNGGFEQCNQPKIPLEAFLSTDYARDIFWADGEFIHYPSGGSKR